MSVLEIMDGGIFEVRSTGGDTHLGGEDFDSRLVDFCLNDLKQKTGIDISGKARAMTRLRTACCKAKILLSSSHAADVEVENIDGG